MTFPWRPLIAVTVVIALATGGALLTLLPASNGEESLTVSSPTDASTTAARTVVVSGTGTEDAIIRIFDDNSNAILLGSTKVADGTFSTVIEYDDDAPAQQGLYIDAVKDGEFLDADVLEITLPLVRAESSNRASSSPSADSTR